jgi:hypothetical protein
MDVLRRFIRDRHLLMLLDNCGTCSTQAPS